MLAPLLHRFLWVKLKVGKEVCPVGVCDDDDDDDDVKVVLNGV